ncbi:S1 family peptidase [Halioglobus maricola]|uniref:S1 family peptidase n=1 Tax=Halioglobus maricola TaxID=2601894 RepID=UPI0014781D33|nr:serine protease [Halioglobus maricola]
MDGIEEDLLWRFKGLNVAIGFVNEENHRIIGSGVMVAPGLCLTASHVIEETLRKQALLHTFVDDKNMRIWSPEDFHAQRFSARLLPFQRPEMKYSDVGVLSCSPFSSFSDCEDYLFAPLRIDVPKIGERLWTTGYRETLNDGVPTVAFFISSGLVTEQYLEGRGSHLQGPCIEVAMEALGGMSGGAVFNEDGYIVGVISSCLGDQNDNKGPTYVTLLWPSLLSTVHSPWPDQYWPNQVGGLQVSVENGGARVSGSARWSDEGSMLVTFYKQSEKAMTSVLQKSGVDVLAYGFEISDFFYEYFEEFLEEKGQEYLPMMDNELFRKSLSESPVTEVIKLFRCVDTIGLEGIEDLEVQSISGLENGCISVNATFNIRGLFMVLEVSSLEYQCHEEKINKNEALHNRQIYGEVVRYEHYVRPYYRVNFAFDTKQEHPSNLKIQTITLRV